MQVLLIVRDRAQVAVDVVGVGASAYDALDGNEMVSRVAYNGANASHGRDRSGTLTFVNKRAEDYWDLREALDPASQEDICLPRDPELKADLCAPRWMPRKGGIQIESKDEIKKRIGRSPDKGDAVVMANSCPILAPKKPQAPKHLVPPTPQAWMA